MASFILSTLTLHLIPNRVLLVFIGIVLQLCLGRASEERARVELFISFWRSPSYP